MSETVSKILSDLFFTIEANKDLEKYCNIKIRYKYFNSKHKLICIHN